MYKLVKTETRSVTPQEAKSFLLLNTFAGQRTPNNRNIRRYADAILDGKMRPVQIAIATLRDGSQVMMNGQHVCYAIELAETEQLAHVEHYECQTNEDAWQLFATFDVHQSRTQKQIFKAAHGLFNDSRLSEVPLAILAACGTALMCIDGKAEPNFHASARATEKTLQPALVDKYADEVLAVNRWNTRKHMIRVGVIAAIIQTLRKDNKKAITFWTLISDGIGFTSKQDPAYRLREDLLDGLPTIGGSNRHKAFYCLCISWWNSWITGDKRQSVKVRSIERLPKVLA